MIPMSALFVVTFTRARQRDQSILTAPGCIGPHPLFARLFVAGGFNSLAYRALLSDKKIRPVPRCIALFAFNLLAAMLRAERNAFSRPLSGALTTPTFTFPYHNVWLFRVSVFLADVAFRCRLNQVRNFETSKDKARNFF